MIVEAFSGKIAFDYGVAYGACDGCDDDSWAAGSCFYSSVSTAVVDEAAFWMSVKEADVSFGVSTAAVYSFVFCSSVGSSWFCIVSSEIGTTNDSKLYLKRANNFSVTINDVLKFGLFELYWSCSDIEWIPTEVWMITLKRILRPVFSSQDKIPVILMSPLLHLELSNISFVFQSWSKSTSG